MMISENDVFSSDSMIFGKEKFYHYVETRMEYHEVRTIEDFSGQTNAFLSVNILLDNQKAETIRKVKTFMMAMQETGGFMTITLLLTMILLQKLQSTVYYTTLIKSFFKF